MHLCFLHALQFSLLLSLSSAEKEYPQRTAFIRLPQTAFCDKSNSQIYPTLRIKVMLYRR
jgi:hypothetical protein